MQLGCSERSGSSDTGGLLEKIISPVIFSVYVQALGGYSIVIHQAASDVNHNIIMFCTPSDT